MFWNSDSLIQTRLLFSTGFLNQLFVYHQVRTNPLFFLSNRLSFFNWFKNGFLMPELGYRCKWKYNRLWLRLRLASIKISQSIAFKYNRCNFFQKKSCIFKKYKFKKERKFLLFITVSILDFFFVTYPMNKRNFLPFLDLYFF